jgi:RNA polymerase sigma-70 factor (ECF subfamily)
MNEAALTCSYIDGGFAGGAAELPLVLRRWFATWTRCNSDSRPEQADADRRHGRDQAVEAASAPSDPAKDVPLAVDPADWADVQGSLDGDDEAFARLVHRYQQDVARYMWRFDRDRGVWEELVHEVFVEGYYALSSFAGRAPLVHWLKRIATRVGYRHWQRRSRRRREVALSGTPAEAVAADDETAQARHAAELVHKLLGSLSPRDRLVMTLMYLEQCSVAEIVQLTGWSESMVKVQAHRARARLRKICERAGIEP